MVAPDESTLPLNRQGASEDETPSMSNYPIEPAIVRWMQLERSRQRYHTVFSSSGGCEGWLQVELEIAAFREEFEIDLDTQVRAQSQVFTTLENPEKVDEETLLLPQTDDFRGMIIKLRCENGINTDAMQRLVQEDLDMVTKVKAKYKHYSFVLLAMVYSPEAHKAVKNIGLDPIPQTEHAVVGFGNIKAYKYMRSG